MIPNTRELVLRNLRHAQGTIPFDGFIFATTYRSRLDAPALFARLTPVEGVPFWEVQLRSTTTSEVRAVVTYLPLAHNGLSYWHCSLCGSEAEPCPHVSFVAKDALGRIVFNHAETPDIDGMTWGVDQPYAHKRYSWQNFEWVFVIRDVAGSLWRLHARNKITGEGMVFQGDRPISQDGLDGHRALFAAAFRKAMDRGQARDQWAITPRFSPGFDDIFDV